MGLTLVEKIISEHAGKEVHAGELVISKVDVTAVQDGTGPLTVQEFKKLGKTKLNNPERTVLFIDHAAPSPRKELSNTHMVLREFHKEYGAVLSDVGAGVCHQRLIETFVHQVHWVLLLQAWGLLMLLLLWHSAKPGLKFLLHLKSLLEENLEKVFVQKI